MNGFEEAREKEPIGMSMSGKYIRKKGYLNCAGPFKRLKATVVLSAPNNIKISPDQLVMLLKCQCGVGYVAPNFN